MRSIAEAVLQGRKHRYYDAITLTLDRSHTTLLLAGFYAAILRTLPHAVDCQIVDKTEQRQRTARDAGLLLSYCATVFRLGYLEISDRNKESSTKSGRRILMAGKTTGCPSPTVRGIHWLPQVSDAPSAQVESHLQAAVEAIEALAGRHQLPARHDAMKKVRKQLPTLAALVDFWWQGVREDVAPVVLSSRWRQWID